MQSEKLWWIKKKKKNEEWRKMKMNTFRKISFSTRKERKERNNWTAYHYIYIYLIIKEEKKMPHKYILQAYYHNKSNNFVPRWEKDEEKWREKIRKRN